MDHGVQDVQGAQDVQNDQGVQDIEDVQDDQDVQDAHPDPVGHGVGAGASEVPVDDDNGHQDTEQADNVIVLFL